MEASSYRVPDAANSNTGQRFFTARPEADQKKLRSRGGIQAAFPLYQMNRRKQKTRQKNQTESKPQKRNERKLSNEKDEKSMCSVMCSVVRFAAYLSVRRRGQCRALRARRALEPNRRRNDRSG